MLTIEVHGNYNNRILEVYRVVDNNHRLNKNVFSCCLNRTTFIDNLMSWGSIFQRVADVVSKSRLPYLTELFLFGTSDVVDADRRGLTGVYQFSISHM